jgi:hypothetical protein
VNDNDFLDLDDDKLEPDDHSGNHDADPAAVDPAHTPDPDYRETDGLPDRAR